MRHFLRSWYYCFVLYCTFCIFVIRKRINRDRCIINKLLLEEKILKKINIRLVTKFSK